MVETKTPKRLSQVIFTFPEICSIESTAIVQPKRFCLKTWAIDMMSIHESQVFELRVEMRFEGCDPLTLFFLFNATNVATRKTRTGCEPWPLQFVLYLLSYQTKWELFVVWVDYKPADNESRSTDMILIHESRVFETTCLLSTNITSSSQLVVTGEITFRIPFRHEFLRPSSLLGQVALKKNLKCVSFKN